MQATRAMRAPSPIADLRCLHPQGDISSVANENSSSGAASFPGSHGLNPGHLNFARITGIGFLGLPASFRGRFPTIPSPPPRPSWPPRGQGAGVLHGVQGPDFDLSPTKVHEMVEKHGLSVEQFRTAFGDAPYSRGSRRSARAGGRRATLS